MNGSMQTAARSRPAGAALLDSGELSQVLHDYMDATRRLEQTHASLMREVSRLRTELESKDRELERRRRLASLGELAAGVAHEVRNPLGAIRLYSGLLRSECGNAEAALRLIEKIDAGIRAIDGVVQDTLALAPRSRRFERAAVRQLVAQACDFCSEVVRRAGVELRPVTDDVDAELVGDPAALQRVLVNLIANAAEASPRGGVVEVRVALEAPDWVALSVLDEGPGLPDELLDRILDPFFTTKEHGTGLGLTIAHRLVEAHGGSLSARNRPQGGAEFVVRLPTGGREGRAAEGAAADQFHAA